MNRARWAAVYCFGEKAPEEMGRRPQGPGTTRVSPVGVSKQKEKEELENKTKRRVKLARCRRRGGEFGHEVKQRLSSIWGEQRYREWPNLHKGEGTKKRERFHHTPPLTKRRRWAVNQRTEVIPCRGGAPYACHLYWKKDSKKS